MTCPWCEHGDYRVRYRVPDFRIVACSKCELLYNRDFAASKASADEVFSDEYYDDVQKEAFEHARDPSRGDLSAPIYETGLSIVEEHVGKGRLLDVGCAFGSFLELARRRGWEVSGVEISPYSSRFAREEMNLDVRTGTLTSDPPQPGSFDLVTFWDVLEHVTDVRDNLSVANTALKDGGYLILTTDNFDGLLAFIADLLYRGSGGLITYPVARFFIPYNTCYFKGAGLRQMVRDSGFEEVSVKGIDYPIDKIKLGKLEKPVLRLLYALGDLIGRNTQIFIVAKKTGA